MFYGSCNTQDMTWHVVSLGFGGFRDDFMMSPLEGLTASYDQKSNACFKSSLPGNYCSNLS